MDEGLIETYLSLCNNFNTDEKVLLNPKFTIKKKFNNNKAGYLVFNRYKYKKIYKKLLAFYNYLYYNDIVIINNIMTNLFTLTTYVGVFNQNPLKREMNNYLSHFC